ncbi:MAG: hypothetical protein K0U17_02080, partial [Betaproteobacteria bacterium]|nr:hypothetical protein [Betaproteobacteria bacterium]
MEINPFHSFIYFVPYYLLGIIYSMENAKINAWLKGKTFNLFLLTVTIAMLMYFLGQTNNAGKASILVWHGIDYMIFQKLSLILFILMFGAGTGLIFILRWFWWRINAWSEISAMIVSGVLSILFNFGSLGTTFFGGDGLDGV